MKLSTVDTIRSHIAAYPVGQYFTFQDVKDQLGLPNMAGKSYIFAALVEKKFVRTVPPMRIENGKRYQRYQKIAEFTLEDARPKNKNKGSGEHFVALKELDIFAFGGCAERIVANLYRTKEFS